MQCDLQPEVAVQVTGEKLARCKLSVHFFKQSHATLFSTNASDWKEMPIIKNNGFQTLDHGLGVSTLKQQRDDHFKCIN